MLLCHNHLITVNFQYFTGQSCNAEFAVEATLNPNQASYAHGVVVTYTCSSGFQHTSGNLARTCTTGAWSGSIPVCTGMYHCIICVHFKTQEIPVF